MEYQVTTQDKERLRSVVEASLKPGRWAAFCDRVFVFENVGHYPTPKCFDSKADGIAWIKAEAERLGYRPDPNRAYHYRIIDNGQEVVLEAMTLPSVGRSMRRWHLCCVPDAADTLIDACMIKAIPKLQLYRWIDTL